MRLLIVNRDPSSTILTPRTTTGSALQSPARDPSASSDRGLDVTPCGVFATLPGPCTHHGNPPSGGRPRARQIRSPQGRHDHPAGTTAGHHRQTLPTARPRQLTPARLRIQTGFSPSWWSQETWRHNRRVVPSTLRLPTSGSLGLQRPPPCHRPARHPQNRLHRIAARSHRPPRTTKTRQPSCPTRHQAPPTRSPDRAPPSATAIQLSNPMIRPPRRAPPCLARLNRAIRPLVGQRRHRYGEGGSWANPQSHRPTPQVPAHFTPIQPTT